MLEPWTRNSCSGARIYVTAAITWCHHDLSRGCLADGEDMPPHHISRAFMNRAQWIPLHRFARAKWGRPTLSLLEDELCSRCGAIGMFTKNTQKVCLPSGRRQSSLEPDACSFLLALRIG